MASAAWRNTHPAPPEGRAVKISGKERRTSRFDFGRTPEPLKENDMLIYCWASGVIEYGKKLPDGAISVLKVKDKEEAEDLIVACCSLSRENNENYLSEFIINQGADGIAELEKFMKKIHADFSKK